MARGCESKKHISIAEIYAGPISKFYGEFEKRRGCCCSSQIVSCDFWILGEYKSKPHELR